MAELALLSDDYPMVDAQRPTIRSRRLGMQLRTLREQRGLTLTAAARLLNRTPSAISKLETGHRGIYRPSLENMLDRYEVRDPELRESIFALARDSGKQGWWQRYEGTLSPSTLDYISLETVATDIWTFQLHLIPGLLQIEPYARAVIASGISLGKPPDVDGLAEIRMRRQQILTSPGPPRLWAIVSETVLHQRVGGAETMRAQLRRLVAASEQDNVTLQVLPFSAGAHPSVNGSFTTLTTNDLSVVLVENLTTGWYLEQAEDIQRYDRVFDHLRATALSASDSRSLINRIMSAHDQP
jgi:transcriptional regulator with XRE-family HTH domain